MIYLSLIVHRVIVGSPNICENFHVGGHQVEKGWGPLIYPTHFSCVPAVSGSLPALAMPMPELSQICQDVNVIRSHISELQRESAMQDQWCHVGYILDFLLFRTYLFLITCYAFVIICMWCIWINQ